MVQEPNFDSFAEEYDYLNDNIGKLFAPHNKYFSQYKIELMKENISFIPKKILEFGCGVGKTACSWFPPPSIRASWSKYSVIKF